MSAVLKGVQNVIDDSRIVRLESDVKHLQSDVTEMKGDLKELRTEFSTFKGDVAKQSLEITKELGSLRVSIESSKLWMLITGGALILSVWGAAVTLEHTLKP